jgi:hypothetical protein
VHDVQPHLPVNGQQGFFAHNLFAGHIHVELRRSRIAENSRGELAFASGDVFLPDCAFHEFVGKTSSTFGSQGDDHKTGSESVQSVDSLRGSRIHELARGRRRRSGTDCKLFHNRNHP